MARPRAFETCRRTRELLRHVAAGVPLVLAAKQANVDPARVLRLLDEPDFFAAYMAVRDRDEVAA